MEGHYLIAVKIVHHHANGRFDWLISVHQSVNPSREAISILSGKYKNLRLLIMCTPINLTSTLEGGLIIKITKVRFQ